MARARKSRRGTTGDRPETAGRAERFLRYGHIFSGVMRDVVGERFLAAVSADGLTLPQLHLLKLLASNGTHLVGEAADFLGVSAPAATKNVDKLERLGLVRRLPVAGDRRARLLEASARGRRLVERYEERVRDRLRPVLARFRPEEIASLTALLERFSILLLAQERPKDEVCLRCAAYGEDPCPVEHVLGDCTYQRARAARAPERPRKRD